MELAALHETLDLHLTRIAELERRLGELTGTASAEAEQTPPPPSRRRESARRSRIRAPQRSTTRSAEHSDRNGATLDRRSRLLAQCEGFDVGAPGGPVGFVEGLRFGSRIDCPDVLEVRGGRFGRQLLLVPIDEVDEIHLADRCLVLRTTPVLASDLLDDLGGRLRRVLRFEHTASSALRRPGSEARTARSASAQRTMWTPAARTTRWIWRASAVRATCGLKAVRATCGLNAGFTTCRVRAGFASCELTSVRTTCVLFAATPAGAAIAAVVTTIASAPRIPCASTSASPTSA